MEKGEAMALRTNWAASWSLLAAAALWLRARIAPREGVSPLSNAWLLDCERKSIRGQY
jgi:hypothetical protein